MAEVSSHWAGRTSTVAMAVRGALHRRSVISTAPTFAMLLALSVAPAQSQDAAGGSAVVEEVIVTGIRQQLESSQARKEDAEEILDSITAADIGALPDRSVTEVLQRIPGVAIGRVPDARDADRIAVEGSGVTVRGLSWVRSELNGRSAFSAKKSRTLGFEDIPPELMAAVDVYKNPSAAMIEGGLSGVVDLRTRLPFDSPIGCSAFRLNTRWAISRRRAALRFVPVQRSLEHRHRRARLPDLEQRVAVDHANPHASTSTSITSAPICQATKARRFMRPAASVGVS